MKAAHKFVDLLLQKNILSQVKSITVDLFGSLALTGKGHMTDQAVFLGLTGDLPETLVIENVKIIIQKIREEKKIIIFGKQEIDFDPEKNLLWHRNEVLPLHTNGMRFTARDVNGAILQTQVYYSIGGGFVVTEEDFFAKAEARQLKYPFKSAKELWEQCARNKMSIKQIILANETAWRTEEETKAALLKLAAIMADCIKRGCTTKGILEGPLHVKRRAADLYENLQQKKNTLPRHIFIMSCVDAYALAVAEENAAGGRIVTAPTNGAAGVIPATLQYFKEFCDVSATDEDIITFFTTAGAIAILYKVNASISGAEVGCQGEVGVACSMAAGALASVLGGNNLQIEKAAEIAMEHNLGLTCDPVAGLVQIPCIERNAIASGKAINAATLALIEGEEHKVSLDEVIATMLQTGKDMQNRYKETSLGGLAVNVSVC
jgi:L-serine dehydratase